MFVCLHTKPSGPGTRVGFFALLWSFPLVSPSMYFRAAIVCFFPLIRIGLLVEAFWSTYYLPPSAYLLTWANEMPYV
ncbi:hypothetical protein QBC38DRAFT_488282, partial [Podospora fimiseda]